MSLFRPETICIGISAAGAALARVAGGRTPRVLAETMVGFVLDPQAPLPGALAAALADPQFKARRARVVLGDALVRYFVAARPAGVRSRAELVALVGARFEEQFGLPAADWEIACDLDPRASSYLACAAPRRLVAALRDLCARQGLRLQALTPYAVSEINRWRTRVPAAPAWFAAVDGAAVPLALRTAQGWQGVRSHALPAAEPELGRYIRGLAERDALLHGVPPDAGIVCSGAIGAGLAATAPGAPRLLGAGLWPGRNAAWSRSYRAALSGVWP